MTRQKVRLICIVGALVMATAQKAIGATTVTLAWDSSAASNIAGYMISIGTQSGVYTQRLDVGNQTTHVVSQLNDGQAYFFIVQAYDTTGMMSAPSNEISNVAGASTLPPGSSVSSVGIASNMAAPQQVGTTISWTASASGGAAPLQYKWWMYNGSAWSALSGWSTANTYAWTPSSANSLYQVGVWARSSWDTAEAPEATSSRPFSILGSSSGGSSSSPPPSSVPPGTISPDPTFSPPASSIVDSLGNQWTFSTSGITLRNGSPAYGGWQGTQYAWCGAILYEQGLNALWYRWNGSSWGLSGTGTSNPCSTTPTAPSSTPPSNATTSPDRTFVPPAGEIVDTSGNHWTFSIKGVTLKNGAPAYGGWQGTQYGWCGGTLYELGLNGRWYWWNGHAWMLSGSLNPCAATTTSTSPATTSPDPTFAPPATQIVDASGNRWTFSEIGVTLRNGTPAYGGWQGTQYAWCQGVLYELGVNNQWYRWTGLSWSLSGGANPCANLTTLSIPPPK